MIKARSSQKASCGALVSSPVKPVISSLGPSTHAILKVAAKWNSRGIGWTDRTAASGVCESDVINGYVSLIVRTTDTFENDLDKKESINLLISQAIDCFLASETILQSA